MIPLASAQEPSQLLRDPGFRLGVVVYDPTPGKLVERGTLTPGDSKSKPAWGLAQWSSRFTLATATRRSLASGAASFADGSKAITFGPANTPEADLTLAMNASQEYVDHPRRSDEPWPHLLVQQSIEKRPAIVELQQLRFHIEYRLKQSAAPKPADLNPALHAAQFQAFLTIQNLNRASRGFGDYVWFGIPLYDNRHRIPTAHMAYDAGTGKFIYTPPGQTYTDRSAHDGQWITIDRDLLPLIHQALEKAWAEGYLKDSRDPKDYRVSEFNLGWELPGTFDVALQLRNLSLESRPSLAAPKAKTP
ncbi:MAG TPA: hypothetical protein VHP11_13970 [Tepidisphaeraceae bacterium]|nr:hypothetical protein [Tepidisphaeraceae bacterium]